MTTDLVRAASADVTVADPEQLALAREHILATGDLSKLTPAQRVAYYLARCAELGLSSLSRPFDWLTLDGKLVLYANARCLEQIGRNYQVSTRKLREANVGDLHVVEMEARAANGRTATASKYVSLRDARGEPLRGQRLGDAFHKAETGARRRAVLALVGLTAPDEDDARGRRVVVDADGNVLDHPTAEQRELASNPTAARVIGAPTFETQAAPEDAVIPPSEGGPTPADVTPPPRPPERASFKPSDEDVKRWLGAWFAAVKGTSLDADDDRHRFVRQWSGGRTESLRAWFTSATERQAGDLLAHVRAITDEERAAIAAASQPDENDDAEF